MRNAGCPRSMLASVIIVFAWTTVATACREHAAPVEVSGAWARSADSGTTTAVYLVLRNHEKGAITLTGAQSTLAASVGLHETMLMGDMVHMMPLDDPQVIAPGDSLVLKERDKHFMVTALKRRLNAGDSLPLTLTLGDGRTLNVNIGVRAP